jgi:hypothetical protein
MNPLQTVLNRRARQLLAAPSAHTREDVIDAWSRARRRRRWWRVVLIGLVLAAVAVALA